MKTSIKRSGEIISENVLLKIHGTKFSIEVLSDPNQYNKPLYFYPEQVKSLKEVVEKYIEIMKLNVAEATSN